MQPGNAAGGREGAREDESQREEEQAGEVVGGMAWSRSGCGGDVWMSLVSLWVVCFRVFFLSCCIGQFLSEV